MKRLMNKNNGELNLFQLTWPIFLEVFLFMLMGLADVFMLSALSDHAVAGVGSANQYMNIGILILEVVGNGAAIVVAQYLGAKRKLEASKIIALAVTMNLILGLLMSSLFLLFSDHVMIAMNLQGDVLTYASSYLAIVGGGIFLQAIINALAATIRVHGWTKQTMFVSLGMNIVHVAGNYLLIFGHFGFPELGVVGAAISSVISRSLALLVFLWLLYQVVEYKIEFKFYISLSKEYMGKIVKIGVPSAAEQVLYQACQIVFLYYTTYIGAEALAARQYAGNISMFTYLFAVAIGTGTSIIVGRYVGANRKDEAYGQVWISVRSAMIFTVVMAGLVTAFREQLVSLFTDDPAVITIAASVLLLSVLLESGRTINIVIINSLRAAGDAKFPVVIGLFSMVLMSLPLGYFLVFHMDMGLIGLYVAFIADEWIRAVLVYFRWKSKVWTKHALVPDHAEQTPAI